MEILNHGRQRLKSSGLIIPSYNCEQNVKTSLLERRQSSFFLLLQVNFFVLLITQTTETVGYYAATFQLNQSAAQWMQVCKYRKIGNILSAVRKFTQHLKSYIQHNKMPPSGLK